MTRLPVSGKRTMSSTTEGTIDFGFWPEVPYHVTAEERQFVPENAAEMDRQNALVRMALNQALAEAQDPSWKQDKPDEYTAVLAYLGTPERTNQYRGSSYCRVCGRHPNGSQDWFKGPFRYPQGYVHYLMEHGFKPPQEVIYAALGS